jgi:hypothetical protein
MPVSAGEVSLDVEAASPHGYSSQSHEIIPGSKIDLRHGRVLYSRVWT